MEGYYALKAHLPGTIEEEIYPTIEVFHGRIHRVKPLTVGQYTGLKDRNGKRIFEGDILKAPLGDRFIVFVVEWDKENGRFLGFTSDRHIMYAGREPKAEIIGNIYDNPELLEETI